MPHLLVVDNDDVVRDQISKFFRLSCWQVDEAEDGQQALAVISPVIDAVVLDLQMPAKGGLETLREIRNRRDLDGVCVILLTAYGTVPSAVYSMRLGAYTYLDKPVSMPVLELTLRSGIAKQRANALRRELLSSFEIDAILDRICSVLSSTLGSEGLFLVLTDARGQILRIRAISQEGLGQDIPPTQDHVNRRFIQRIRENKQSLFESDPKQVQELDPILPDAKCLLATLIPGRNGRIAGFIDIESAQENAFHEGWEDVLTYIADLTGIALDIAQRERQVANLRAEQALYRSLPTMVSVLSHRLSTPLQVITNQVNAIDLGGFNNDRSREALSDSLEAIRRRAFEIARVIDELNRVSRLPDIDKPAREVVDLAAFLRAQLHERRLEFERTRVVLIEKWSPTEGLTVETNPMLLRYSLDCLLNNAIEAIQSRRSREEAKQQADSGLIVSRRDSVTVSLESDAGTARVSIVITDTGIGVEESDRDRLFVPLFTTKDSNKQPKRGIGLYSARRYMTSIGGTLEYLGRPDDGGATFGIGMSRGTG